MENENEETIESLVAEFNAYGKAAAENLIRGYRSVARAKAKGKNRFIEFCDGTGLDPKSSTTRKYALIGAEADWLLPIADRLPPDWTTIYDVVKIGQARAEELVHRGFLHPQMTAKELMGATTTEMSDDVVSDTSTTDEMPDTVTDDDKGIIPESCILRIDASNLSDSDRLMLFVHLVSAAAPYGLAVAGLPERLAERVIIEREAA